MNYIDIGYFEGKLLHLIGGKYINGTIVLSLLNNNTEYVDVTVFVEKLTFNTDGYIILNPNLKKELKSRMIKKNIFRCINKFVYVDNIKYEIAMLNKNVYDKLLKYAIEI